MPQTFSVFKKAARKNIWVIIGALILASAWLLEKRSIRSQQKEIESKRIVWDQYRVDNNIYALITSKFETMRIVNLATLRIPRDTATEKDINSQLRATLFDDLHLRIERDEALFLLEKDPIDEDTARMLNSKRVEAANVYNSGDMTKLLALHERDNDYSFNNAETRTHQFVHDYADLLKSDERTESVYFFLYIIGSVLIVLQKIMDTIRHEKETVSKQPQNNLVKGKGK